MTWASERSFGAGSLAGSLVCICACRCRSSLNSLQPGWSWLFHRWINGENKEEKTQEKDVVSTLVSLAPLELCFLDEWGFSLGNFLLLLRHNFVEGLFYQLYTLAFSKSWQALNYYTAKKVTAQLVLTSSLCHPPSPKATLLSLPSSSL